MAQETILFVQGIEMPPDVLELARTLMPKGFELRTVPARARSSEVAEAMREVELRFGLYLSSARRSLP